MDRKQYKSGFKCIGIIIEIIFTVIFVMSVFLLGALIQKQMLDPHNVMNDKFVDSGYYSVLFEEKTDTLVDFLRMRAQFEVDGDYQADKEFSTLDYVANLGTRQNNSNQKRVVQTEDGVVTIETATTEASSVDITLEESYADDKKSNVSNRHLLEVMSFYTLSDLVTWSNQGYSEVDGHIEETFLPVSGESIEDALAADEITQPQADRLYDALKTTLDSIGTEETAYKRARNEFEVEDSNLTYCYCENGKVVYTNVVEDNQQLKYASSILEYAQSKGSFLYYNDGDLQFKTNVTGMEDYFYNTLDAKLSGLGSGATFMVAVDTDFTMNGVFAEEKAEYATWHPWVMISIIMMVISLFTWVIALVYLTIAAGHTIQGEEIVLNAVDRVKTELVCAIYFAITMAMIVMAFAVSEGSWGIPGMLVLVGVVAFLYDSCFLLFYLSMVRRLKAGILWENSVCCWLLRSGSRVMKTWRSSMRVLIIYGADALFCLLAAYMSFGQRNVMGYVFLLMALIGNGLFYLRENVQHNEIMGGIARITEGDIAYKIPMDNLHGDNLDLAEAINSIGDGLNHAVDENTRNERMKADLITNVSHDIKTPLTSIINYVNLIKLEELNNDRVKGYVDILEDKSQRLKQLTEDLVEASRISSGNIKLQMTRINMVELIYQTAGEFNERFEAKDLTTITKLPKESIVIMADGRRIWRVVENLYSNVAKYAMAHTRVYVTMEQVGTFVTFSIKNISEQPLDVDSKDLTERFIRGDESRTTEGSGLGLSIAENLTTLMGGRFSVELDGDLFTAEITFPVVD